MTNEKIYDLAAKAMELNLGAKSIFELCKKEGLSREEIECVNRLSDLLLFYDDTEYIECFKEEYKGTRVFDIAVEYILI